MVCIGTQFRGPLSLPSIDVLASAFYSLSALLQITITAMITYKLTMVRQRLKIGGVYTSIIEVLAESAALYTVATIIFLVLLITRSDAEVWWGQLLYSISVSWSTML
jgi:hypothetical protein